jgi:steroid delta-isomerase-like uncharacterized protein
MSTTTADELRKRHEAYIDAWNRGDFDGLDTFFSEDVVVHFSNPEEDAEGLDEYRESIEEARETFPDLHTEIKNLVIEGELLVAQWVASGTNEGPIPDLDLEATGESVEWEGVTVHRLDGGKVTESWFYENQLDVLMQLGLLSEDSL